MRTLTARRSSTTASGWSRATLFDRQRVALELLAIHLLDGSLGLLLGGHLNESEPSGFAGGSVPYDSDACDLTEGLECLS
jgi:hypothetical protein